MIFNSPTVFNFFLPEHQPAGAAVDANLVSPEAQLASSPAILGFLNGMSSLIHHGLTSCHNGFGSESISSKAYAYWRRCNNPRIDGVATSPPHGQLQLVS